MNFVRSKELRSKRRSPWIRSRSKKASRGLMCCRIRRIHARPHRRKDELTLRSLRDLRSHLDEICHGFSTLWIWAGWDSTSWPIFKKFGFKNWAVTHCFRPIDFKPNYFQSGDNLHLFFQATGCTASITVISIACWPVSWRIIVTPSGRLSLVRQSPRSSGIECKLIDRNVCFMDELR